MRRTGRGRTDAPTSIAPASSARTNGPRASSAIRASPRGSWASSAPWKLALALRSYLAPADLEFCEPTPAATGSLLLASSILSSALSTFAYRPGYRLLSRSMSMATNGSPSKYCRRNWLRAAAQRVHPARRPHSGSTPQANRFACLNWSKILDRWARQVNPLLPKRHARRLPSAAGSSIRPSTPPTCCSMVARPWPACTDRSWNMRYRPLLPKTSSVFSAASGTAASTARSSPAKTTAGSGTRIKHRMKSNWLKMYDKFGLMLQVKARHQQPARILGLSHEVAPRRHFIGGGLPDD